MYFQKLIPRAFALVATLLLSATSYALREVGEDEPVKDGPWPDGAVEVANLKSRFRYSTGDGAYTEFLYHGDTAAFQQALAAFAKVRVPSLELIIHDGPYSHWIARRGKDEGFIDWSCILHDPEAWHAIYNNPQSAMIRGENKPVPAPRIDVYVAVPAAPEHIDWTKIKIPDGISVKDERATAAKEIPPDGPVLRGTIYNMANFKTIPGATIEARQYDQTNKKWQSVASVTADAAGAYSIEKLPPGEVRIVASAKGFAPRVLGYQVIHPKLAVRLDGELSAEVTVIGTVTDEQDAPLKDVQIQLESTLAIDGRAYTLPENPDARTDAEGHFTFSGLQTGYAQFRCKANGHVQLQSQTLHKLQSWHKFNANATEVLLTGDVRVDLRMALPGKVNCKVTSANELPLNDTLNVTIAEAEGGYSTGRPFRKYQRSTAIDRNGNADFGDLRPGRYFVTVGYWVDVPETKIVTINAGKTTEVQLTAKPKPKPAPAKEDPPKPVRPPRPPTTDDKF